VLGSAVAFGGDVRVFNGAVVQGDAVSFGGRVVVEDGGAVEGNRVTLGQAASALTGSSLDLRHPDWVQALARRLVVLFSFAGAGVLVVGLFPRQVDTVATTLTAHPLRSGITGLLLTGFACLLTLIFAVTLIGIPIALFIAVVIAIAALLGFIALCQAAGDHIPWSNQGARRWLAFLMGVVGLGLLGSLPFIGKAALAALGLSCMGAALQTRLGTREWVD
jgi:hypothetical protein